jgi:hypothetical protein
MLYVKVPSPAAGAAAALDGCSWCSCPMVIAFKSCTGLLAGKKKNIMAMMTNSCSNTSSNYLKIRRSSGDPECPV